MSKHSKSIPLLLAAALTTASVSTSAQTPAAAPTTPARAAAPTPAKPSSGCPGWRGLAVLGNLGDVQRQKLDALQSKSHRDLQPLHQQLAQRRAELEALWAAEAPQRESILQKQAEIAGLRAKLQTASVDHRLAVLALLTPEQRALLRSSRAQAPGAGMQRGCMMHERASGDRMTMGHGPRQGGMAPGGMMRPEDMGCNEPDFDAYACAEGLCSN